MSNVQVQSVLRYLLLPSLVVVILIGNIPSATAQTPVGITNVTGDIEPAADALAANNPWFGAQIINRLGTEGEFASNLLAAGQFVFDVPLGADAGEFRLPIISNFGGRIAPAAEPNTLKEQIDSQLKDLLDSATGITAGLFPYYPFKLNDSFMVTIHGLGAWRYNALKPLEPAGDAAAELVNIHQIKLGAGIEVVAGRRDQGPAAVTFSITPVLTRFTDDTAYKRAFGDSKIRLGTIELVGILPLRASGLGVVFENVTGGGQNSFRIGLLIAGQP